MANTVYSNFIIESKLNDNLDTKLNAKNLMTIDSGLTASEGMTIKVNKYTYTGEVETLAKGVGSTANKRGSLTVASTDYTVKLYQQAFDYFDEEFMIDNKVVDYGVAGASNEMVNQMTDEFFTEIAKATLKQTYANGGALSYDTVVDAIARMNLEDESGLFLIVGNDLKAQIRKDEDFKSKELGKVIADGAIGTLCGVPVICSKRVPSKKAYLATKEAVTLFTKKDSEVEQDRNADTRKNSIYLRRVGLVALTDATKVVEISEAAAQNPTG